MLSVTFFLFVFFCEYIEVYSHNANTNINTNSSIRGAALRHGTRVELVIIVRISTAFVVSFSKTLFIAQYSLVTSTDWNVVNIQRIAMEAVDILNTASMNVFYVCVFVKAIDSLESERYTLMPSIVWSLNSIH